MSTSDHTSNGIEALQRFYQAGSEYVQTGGKDFGPVAATLHPQIVMIQADSLPFGGQWHGREGFERWMQAFGEAWSSVSATDLRFFEHDDTVVVVAQMEATARASGQFFPRADLPRRPDPRRPVDGVPDVLLGHGGDEPRASRVFRIVGG